MRLKLTGIVVAALSLATTHSALAARPMAPVVYDWSGIYAGANRLFLAQEKLVTFTDATFGVFFGNSLIRQPDIDLVTFRLNFHWPALH